MAGNDMNAAVFMAHNVDIIYDQEMALLKNVNRPHQNLTVPYWQYEKVDLNQMTNNECKSEFRFEKRDMFNLKDVLHFPEEIFTYNRQKVDTTEAICIFLKRVAYPYRYLHSVSGKPPQICNCYSFYRCTIIILLGIHRWYSEGHIQTQ